MYKNSLIDNYYLVMEDEEELDKELDKVDNEIISKIKDKTIKNMEKKETSKDIHEKNPLFQFFNGKQVKMTNLTQIKSLMSKDTGVLSKIGYVIATIGLYIISSISFSASIIKSSKTRSESYINNNITKQLLNLQPSSPLIEDNLIQKTTASIKTLYHSKKIIQSMSSILVKLYGGATQLLYVLSNISLTVISFIFFSIGTLMIKYEGNEKIFEDLNNRISSILANKGSTVYHRTNKKGEIIKNYAKLCFSYVWQMTKYLPSALKETVVSAWRSIKNIPQMITNFFKTKKDSYEYSYDDMSFYKEEIIKEFFNPFNIIKFILDKIRKMPKVFLIIAAGILVIGLAIKTSNAALPTEIENTINQMINPAKQVIKNITDENSEKIADTTNK